jgi:peptide/nickel transport system permease protein
LGQYTVRRLIVAIPTLLGVTLAVFFLTHIVPGDPALTLVGENATAEQLELARRYLNLDQPIYLQYLSYLGNLLHGDFGTSISGLPVVQEFAVRFPATVELTAAALIYAVGAGIPLGILAARHAGRSTDFVVSIVALMGLSVPTFVLGLLLQYIFAVQLALLPATGQIDPRLSIPTTTHFILIDAALAGRWDAFLNGLSHLVLPALTLGSLPLAYVSRLTRAAVVEAAGEDYVRTARGKGVPDGAVVWKHIMPNAWLPVITIIGLQVGHLLAGAVITETVFNWNGVGSWVVHSIESHDFVVVQSCVILFAAVFIVINLVVDLTYGLLDPRIRYD